MNDVSWLGLSKKDLEALSKLKQISEDVRIAWVKALRSGEYVQIDPGMKSWIQLGEKYDKFCCLSVLIDLQIRAGCSWEWKDSGRFSRTLSIMNSEANNKEPNKVKFFIFLGTLGMDRALAQVFIKMNDLYKMNFSEIADVIEKYA